MKKYQLSFALLLLCCLDTAIAARSSRTILADSDAEQSAKQVNSTAKPKVKKDKKEDNNGGWFGWIGGSSSTENNTKQVSQKRKRKQVSQKRKRKNDVGKKKKEKKPRKQKVTLTKEGHKRLAESHKAKSNLHKVKAAQIEDDIAVLKQKRDDINKKRRKNAREVTASQNQTLLLNARHAETDEKHEAIQDKLANVHNANTLPVQVDLTKKIVAKRKELATHNAKASKAEQDHRYHAEEAGLKKKGGIVRDHRESLTEDDDSEVVKSKASLKRVKSKADQVDAAIKKSRAEDAKKKKAAEKKKKRDADKKKRDAKRKGKKDKKKKKEPTVKKDRYSYLQIEPAPVLELSTDVAVEGKSF
jgi:hypothetical protein